MFLLVLLISCSHDESVSGSTANPAKDLIIPQAGPGIILDSGSADTSLSGQNGSPVDLHIKLEPGQLLQSAYNLNLDADAVVEQIAIFKLKGDPDDLLRVMIIDFDPVRSVWGNTWQGVTRATNIKTFTLRVMDLTADGLPEIVCQGINKNGEQTLDVFKIISSGFPLQYASVLSISADISVEVQHSQDQNSTEISTGGDALTVDPAPKPGTSLDIIAQSKDLESQNSLDMVQTTYKWRSAPDNPAGGQYIVATTTKIPGSSVQEAALDQLFKGSAADFEKKYLAGAWIHSFVDQRKKNIVQLLFFDPAARTIRLVEGDRMESHEWQSSHKPVYGGTLQVYLVNESFRSQRSMAIIEAQGVNNLSFSFQDRDDWKGDFTRVKDDLAASFSNKVYQSVAINHLILNGLYRGDSGLEIVFASPRFTWRTGDKKQQGSFLSYELNDSVLELKFLDGRGMLEEERYFIATLTEGQGASGKRILTLQEAHIGINGVAPLSSEPLRLEQSLSDNSQ